MYAAQTELTLQASWFGKTNSPAPTTAEASALPPCRPLDRATQRHRFPLHTHKLPLQVRRRHARHLHRRPPHVEEGRAEVGERDNLVIEARLEAMRLSDPSDCIIYNGICLSHVTCGMLQIFSIELAKIPVDGGGLVELYGYIAVRDDPITVEQGSLIKMVGPKRGIYMMDLTLVEYDMRIKTGEQEKDDLQLIDGASLICPQGKGNQPFLLELASDCGVVGINLSCLVNAVEATIEVLISEVQSSFYLSLGCLTSGLDKEIRLFDGTIAESHVLKRSVVAVVMDSSIDLKVKVGPMSPNFDQHCSFMAKAHGHDTQEIKTDFALFLVKLTWSVLI
ncbi:hypothetical protein EJB05_21508, partial [Eragrostis curvula]